MRRRLVSSYVALVAVALLLFTVPVALSSADLLERTLEGTATREANLFVPLVLRDDAAAERAIHDRTRDFEGATGSRVLLVRAGDYRGGDPQIEAALAGRDPGARWGRNDLLGGEAVSVVVPAVRDGAVVAVVQVIAPADDVRAEIRGIWLFRLAVGLAVLGLAVGVAFALAGTVIGPLRRLTEVAGQIGEGRFDLRAEESGPPEIATLAGTLNRTSRQTRVLLEAQRAFVADASHQLRTPLTAMRLSLDNARAATDEPVVQAGLDQVDGEMRRMTRLVERLLLLARSESLTSERTPVDLAGLVRDRVSLWAAAGEDAAVHLSTRGPGSASVLATAGSIEQVLDNLLDNALATTPGPTEVQVAVEVAEEWTHLVVSDDGPGIDEAHRERAFDRFWSTRVDGGGSGLGLAVVRELVDKDGGSVVLGAAPTGGLEVHVRLRTALPSPARTMSRF